MFLLYYLKHTISQEFFRNRLDAGTNSGGGSISNRSNVRLCIAKDRMKDSAEMSKLVVGISSVERIRYLVTEETIIIQRIMNELDRG